jgi:hypothetical protein
MALRTASLTTKMACCGSSAPTSCEPMFCSLGRPRRVTSTRAVLLRRSLLHRGNRVRSAHAAFSAIRIRVWAVPSRCAGLALSSLYRIALYCDGVNDRPRCFVDGSARRGRTLPNCRPRGGRSTTSSLRSFHSSPSCQLKWFFPPCLVSLLVTFRRLRAMPRSEVPRSPHIYGAS